MVKRFDKEIPYIEHISYISIYSIYLEEAVMHLYNIKGLKLTDIWQHLSMMETKEAQAHTCDVCVNSGARSRKPSLLDDKI